MNKRKSLKEPYFAHDPDVINHNGYTGFGVGNDLNREIVKPGTNKDFPDGAVGIRVDDNFWVVAALPYEKYKNITIKDIVAEFWPELTDPIFKPDSDDPWWKEYWSK